MNQIKWCFEQKKGLVTVEPNVNMHKSYLSMAEESINALDKLNESKIWTAATTYYIFYYSLYALLIRIGFKCEIHRCTIAFMQRYLTSYYDNHDIRMIEQAFSNRSDLQYYANRPVDDTSIMECKRYCKDFFLKTKEAITRIKESDIKSIREKVELDLMR